MLRDGVHSRYYRKATRGHNTLTFDDPGGFDPADGERSDQAVNIYSSLVQGAACMGSSANTTCGDGEVIIVNLTSAYSAQLRTAANVTSLVSVMRSFSTARGLGSVTTTDKIAGHSGKTVTWGAHTRAVVSLHGDHAILTAPGDGGDDNGGVAHQLKMSFEAIPANACGQWQEALMVLPGGTEPNNTRFPSRGARKVWLLCKPNLTELSVTMSTVPSELQGSDHVGALKTDDTATLGVVAERDAATPSPADCRERIKFDFGWKHTLLHGQPAPPPPPPMGKPDCSAGFPANASGIDCTGGVPFIVPNVDAAACASACCSDPYCVYWQFNNASTNERGGGVVDEKKRCMLSPTPPRPSCTNNTSVVGGSRPAREPSALGPAPPAPSTSDHPEQAQPGFDDSSWQAVDVPHDMNVDQAPERIACEYGCGGRSFLARHSGWYRKAFRVPGDWAADSHISIEFEGVFRHSMVYLNGHYLQNHTSGYTSFDVALPRAVLKTDGQTNVLAVYADARSGSGWWYE